MRKVFIAGNWKMNMTHLETMKFLEEFGFKFGNKNKCDIAVCPPFTALRSAMTVINDDNLEIKLGAQNMYFETKGAFTGEISPDMLKALNVEYVILGHSERRQYFNETDKLINKKVKAVFENKLKPILCIGETIDIRESGREKEFVIGQLTDCLDSVDREDIVNITIAYEPIWAIGTGKTATSEDANNMCSAIRAKIAELYSSDVANAVRIQYGGSVKPSNISELMNMPDIDGALVGGASLKADDFLAIINY